MKCPICGCKMKDEFMCPYCKITGEQVRSASNKQAREKLKKGDKKDVYTSTYLPSDVNNTRLFLVALFGGFVGAHCFYVGKRKSGFAYVIGFILLMAWHFLYTYAYPNSTVMMYIANVGYALGAVLVFLWISNCVQIMFKHYGIPVVLGEPKTKSKEGKKKK